MSLLSVCTSPFLCLCLSYGLSFGLSLSACLFLCLCVTSFPPGQITVAVAGASFLAGGAFSAVVGSDGVWSVSLGAQPAGTGSTLKFSGSDGDRSVCTIAVRMGKLAIKKSQGAPSFARRYREYQLQTSSSIIITYINMNVNKSVRRLVGLTKESHRDNESHNCGN